MKKSTFNPALFWAVAQFASTEEARYYLNGVAIQAHPKKGVLLIATDGHRMVTAHDPEGFTPQDIIVSVHTGYNTAMQAKNGLIKAAKLKAPIHYAEERAGAVMAVDIEADSVSITVAGETVFMADKVLVDGTFPDWRRIRPRGPFDGACTGFNPKYLGEFYKVAGLDIGSLEKGFVGNGSKRGIFLNTMDETSPAEILFGDGLPFYGVLMPMRISDSQCAAPAWLAG